MTVNGAAQSLVGKRKSIRAKSPVPLPAMGAVFILNLIGISVFIPQFPRGTEEYIKTYNNRAGSERVNNRILNDYHLHDMMIHSKKRYSFFAMIAAINIHLDARIKKMKLDAAA